VTEQKAVVERYADGFRTGDLAKILSCLADDVVWAQHDSKTLAGKAAFAVEADTPDAPKPERTMDRLVEDGDMVAAVGHGRVALGDGDPAEFVYTEVFTFTDGLVSRLDTFHIWLSGVPAA